MDVIRNPRERMDPAEEMPSREEEERYRKLLSENDELQRLIAEVSQSYVELIFCRTNNETT